MQPFLVGEIGRIAFKLPLDTRRAAASLACPHDELESRSPASLQAFSNGLLCARPGNRIVAAVGRGKDRAGRDAERGLARFEPADALGIEIHHLPSAIDLGPSVARVEIACVFNLLVSKVTCYVITFKMSDTGC